MKDQGNTEERRASMQREWESIFQAIGQPALVLDPQHRIIAANRATSKAVGKTEEELLGKRCYEVFHGADKPAEGCPLEKMISSGHLETLEMEMETLHGTFLVSCTPLFDDAGKLFKILHIATDITERKHVERALQRSEEKAKQLAQENAVIAEIGHIISSSLDLEAIYERFTEELHKLISWDRTAFTILNPDGDTATLAYVSGMDIPLFRPGTIFRMAGSTTWEAVKAKTGSIINTEDEDAVISRIPSFLPVFKAGIRSTLIMPLISRNEVVGVLTLQSVKRNAYADKDLGIAERVGHQIAGAIANAQLWFETKRAESAAKWLAHETSILAEIGRIINSSLNIEEVYKAFAEKVRELIRFDRLAIGLINAEQNTVGFPYIEGISVPARQPRDVIPLAGTVAEKMLQTRAGIIFRMENEEEISVTVPGLLPEFRCGIRSALTVPLISRDRVIGTLSFRSTIPGAYTDRELGVAESIGNQIAGAIANAHLFSELKGMEAALRKSEERFRELYDHAPVGYHEFDLEGRITNVNRTDLEMLGYTAEEIIGRHVWELNVEPEGVREQVLAKLAGTLPPVRNLELTYRRKDGTTFPVLIEGRLVLDEQGRIMGIRSTIQDITERKRAEREKAYLSEQLHQSQKMEAIGTLAGGIAHDFNNILSAILGYAELASLELKENSKAKYYLEHSMTAARRAKDLVQQILAFSRQGKEERKLLNIKPIIIEGLKFLRAALPATIEIQPNVEEDLGTIEADPTQVHQVLMNLCTNAAHAMEEKGGVLEVSLCNMEMGETSAITAGIDPGPYVRLRVRDTGHGMPPKVLKRIFDPYFTTKGVGKGTGLGLAVVQGIVKGYGGGIIVSSEVGKGSTLDIYFPRIEAADLPSGGYKLEPLPLGGHERILFVDDEEAIVEIGREVLEYLGYEVVTTTGSVEALDLFRAQAERFDLVITDLTMPNMTGDRLAQELLKIRPGIPIILCTGFSEHITEEKAKAMGIQELAMKPIVLKELAKTLRRALGNREKKSN